MYSTQVLIGNYPMNNKAHLAKLYQHLSAEQIEALKEKSTMTRIIWAENFVIRNRILLDDRPENQDLETPAAVQFLRMQESLMQRLERIDANTSKTEGFMHSLANLFKFGASEVEKTYPSKKSRV